MTSRKGGIMCSIDLPRSESTVCSQPQTSQPLDTGLNVITRRPRLEEQLWQPGRK
eukprot:CAMPEP_0115157812 /NCGR_PEP_ID=MMETSP0227-20121206/69233_1 /TAXON_ID=89957 /ORGANISM="Polarella glacialis, Strain CCMP 1383" /LENGTH=54 /DNA_ID=CAMNT_0002569191 /DNA_START=1028 /DNA_END=1192 /DNA_ORIENTATION=-